MSYSDFTVVFHGGYCCGIKTIKGFPPKPTDMFSAKEKKTNVNNDECGENTRSDIPFFTGAAPAETALERLHTLVNFTRRRRPEGLIEATLRESESAYWDQVTVWAKHLKKLGFKQVSRFKNSNSGNYIRVYHLICKMEEE